MPRIKGTRYRIIGSLRVFGHEPGAEFTRVIDPVQEQRLLAGGHIERVRRPRSVPDKEGNADG